MKDLDAPNPHGRSRGSIVEIRILRRNFGNVKPMMFFRAKGTQDQRLHYHTASDPQRMTGDCNRAAQRAVKEDLGGLMACQSVGIWENFSFLK